MGLTTKVNVIARCKSPEEAARLAEKHRTITGVVAVNVVENIITFVCEVAKNLALTTYGKIKDVFPFYCQCTCCPVAQLD